MDKERIRLRVYWAWLRSCLALHPPALHRLMQQFGSPIEVYRSARSGGLSSAAYLNPNERSALTAMANPDSVEENWDALQSLKIGVVLREDPLFPKEILDLHDPPYFLYMRGNPQALKRGPRLCIVGTRNPTEYGRTVAYTLARQWGEMGGCVVSGMALGTDAIAHEGALDAGTLSTIAVLPGGLDLAQPRSNEGLFQRLLQNGLLLSENPPGFPLLPRNIPPRNRLMAALSQGVLLAEAPLKSGTQYTIAAALDLGREVFAVPGRIDNANSALPNQLIREGAKIVNEIQDIVEEFPGLSISDQNSPPPFPAESKGGDPLSRQTKRDAGESSPAVLARPSERPRQRPPLTDAQQRILDALPEEGGNADGIVMGSGMPVHVVLREISRLQADGYIRTDEMGRYFPIR